MADLMERIQRLPPDELKAFEDAVLKRVRTDETLKKAFEKDPMNMPAVAGFAVSAHEREVWGLQDVPQTADRPPVRSVSRAPAAPASGPPSPAVVPLAPHLPGPDLPSAEELRDASALAASAGISTAAALALNRAKNAIIANDAAQYARLTSPFPTASQGQSPVNPVSPVSPSLSRQPSTASTRSSASEVSAVSPAPSRTSTQRGRR